MDTVDTADIAQDFTDYVSAARPALVRRAYSMTGEHHSAEDLVQAVLTKVFPAWDRIREPRAANAYVRRAMANHHVSASREPWRRQERTVVEVPDPRRAADVVRAVDDGPGPDERAALWRLVQQLPPQQRRTVVLRFYEDLSEAQTAQVLGTSVGAVKSNTSRGLATLRRLAATTPGRLR